MPDLSPQEIQNRIAQVRASANRQGHESLWRQCADFYKGLQWGQVEKTIISGVVTEINTSAASFYNARDERVTDNHCQRAAEFLKSAIITERNLAPDVLAATGDASDQMRAKGAGKYLKTLQRKIGWRMSESECGGNTIILGNGVWFVGWDKMAGGIDPRTGQPEGEVDFQSVDPWCWFPEPGCKRDLNCRWTILVTYQNINDLRANPDYDTEGVEPDGDFQKYQQGTAGLASLNSEINQRVTIYSLWELPTDDAPKGTYYVCTETKELFKGPLPYNDGPSGPCLPFVHIPCLLAPGEFYGYSTLASALSFQRNHNSCKTSILAHLKKFGKQKLDAPVGSCSQEDFDPYAEVTWYDPAFGKVSVRDVPQISGQVFQYLEDNRKTLDDLLGYQDVLQGAAQSGDSGRRIALLQQKAMSRFADVAARWEEGFRRAWVMALARIKQFYTGPRLIRVAGESSGFVSMWFNKEELPDYCDVEVTAEFEMGGNREASFDKIKELVGVGYFNPAIVPPDAQKKLAQQINLPSLEAMTKLEELTSERAMTENEELLAGPGAFPADISDEYPEIRGIHVRIHQEELCGPRSEEPGAAERLRSHLESHMGMQAAYPLYEQLIAQKAQQEMMARFGIAPQPPQTPMGNGQPPTAAQPQPGPMQQGPVDAGVSGPPQQQAVQMADMTGEQAVTSQLGGP